jgi:hypothetical protein
VAPLVGAVACSETAAACTGELIPLPPAAAAAARCCCRRPASPAAAAAAARRGVQGLPEVLAMHALLLLALCRLSVAATMLSCRRGQGQVERVPTAVYV